MTPIGDHSSRSDDLVERNRALIEAAESSDVYERLRAASERIRVAMNDLTECTRGGNRHLYQRDYVLGIFPVGRPYCVWCGDVIR